MKKKKKMKMKLGFGFACYVLFESNTESLLILSAYASNCLFHK